MKAAAVPGNSGGRAGYTCSITTGRTGGEDQWWRNAEVRSRFKDAPAKQSSGGTGGGEHEDQTGTFSRLNLALYFEGKKKKT